MTYGVGRALHLVIALRSLLALITKKAKVCMDTFRLESREGHKNHSAERIVKRCRQRVKTNRKAVHQVVTTLAKIFGIPRPIAVAVLYGEVQVRSVDPDGTIEFNWPNNGSLEAW